MKIKILTILVALLSSQAWASAFPVGNYHGHGLWKSLSEKGNYTNTISINNNSVSTDYKLPDGSRRKWNFEMSPQQNGFFKVISEGTELGQGYCLEKAEVCHYEIKQGTFSLEETFTLLDGRLYRFGSKDYGKGRIMWQEAADKD
jgi:hypothetical protein